LLDPTILCFGAFDMKHVLLLISLMIIPTILSCSDAMIANSNEEDLNEAGIESTGLFPYLDQEVDLAGNQTNQMNGNQVKTDRDLIQPIQDMNVAPNPNDPNPNDPIPNDPNPNDPIPNDPNPNDPIPNDPNPNDPIPNDPNQPVQVNACDQCNANQFCCNNQCVDRSVDRLAALGIEADSLPLVARDPNACGKLRYGLYRNEGDDAKLHSLPDFSYAGYLKGGVPIPNDIPTVVTLSPIAGNNRGQIQAAIDQVSQLPLNANGYRGAVLLTRGTYEVGNTLNIRSNGVVLRGEGQGNARTIIRATRRAQHELIVVGGQAVAPEEIPDTRVNISASIVPVGSRIIELAGNHSFQVGDVVFVTRTPNDAWINRLDMGQYAWRADRYDIGHERVVTAVQQNQISIDIPIMDAIDQAYGGGYVVKINISNRTDRVGIEDIQLVSDYTGSTDEQHAWVAIAFRYAQNSWVRRVTTKSFGYSAVMLADSSAFNTIEEVAMLDPVSQIDGGRRYSFKVDDAIGTLFQRCYARNGRHNFVTGARTRGPNVWLDSSSVENHSDEGPHHRWSTGILFDNVKSSEISVHNRGGSGSVEGQGHGWAGAQVLFWNTRASSMRCDSPLGAINWSVGAVGSFQGGYEPESPCMRISSGPNATRVNIRSLYLAQLADRLGEQAVQAITIEAQRNGRIWSELETWAGQGRLANHLPMP
jgi:hypothetical protein